MPAAFAQGEEAGGSRLRAIVDGYVSANGGERALMELKATEIEGTIRQKGEKLAFQVFRKRPNQLRMVLKGGDSRAVYGVNRRRVWRRVSERGMPGEARELEGRAARVLRREAIFDSALLRYRRGGGVRLELEGTRMVDNAPVAVIAVEEPGGANARLFVDASDYRLLRRVELGPDGEPRLTTRYGDHVTREGYRFAREIENSVAGQVVSKARVERITLNPGLLNFLFEMPEG